MPLVATHGVTLSARVTPDQARLSIELVVPAIHVFLETVGAFGSSRPLYDASALALRRLDQGGSGARSPAPSSFRTLEVALAFSFFLSKGQELHSDSALHVTDPHLLVSQLWSR